MEERINALRREIARMRLLAATCEPALQAEFLALAKVMQGLIEELMVLLHNEAVD